MFAHLRIVLGLMLASLLPLGCTNMVEGKVSDKAGETTLAGTLADETPTIPVEAVKPGRKDVSAYLVTSARVEAERRVDVMPQGMGKCLEVFVEEGERVEAGTVLAELDREELEAQIRQTRVNISQQANALAIAERALSEGIGNKVERDNARFAHEQSLANLSAQEVRLKNQTITSPITGVVTRRNIQKGMFVGSGAPAFTVVDPSSFMLPIFVPERELGNLQSGQEALVNIDSLPGETLSARVGRINPSVDPVNGTVEVMLNFDAAEQGKLRESAFARVRLVMATHASALVVPKDSVLEENTRKYVMTVAPGEGPEGVFVAKRVEVETGLEDDNDVEILKGVTEEGLVVTLGQHTLKEDTKVTITNAEKELGARVNLSAEEALESAAAKEKAKLESAAGGQGDASH